MVVTCAHMDIRTSQAMDRSRRHHTLQFTFMSHRSYFVCVSGAFRLLRHRRCSLDSALMCVSLEIRRDCNTCDGMTNRVLIDDGARWILHGDEQDREIRTAGVKALHSMLASTTSGRAKEFVKQGLSDRNGMIAFGRIRERFGKTAGVAKLSDVCQFQWTSSDSLEASG